MTLVLFRVCRFLFFFALRFSNDCFFFVRKTFFLVQIFIRRFFSLRIPQICLVNLIAQSSRLENDRMGQTNSASCCGWSAVWREKKSHPLSFTRPFQQLRSVQKHEWHRTFPIKVQPTLRWLRKDRPVCQVRPPSSPHSALSSHDHLGWNPQVFVHCTIFRAFTSF